MERKIGKTLLLSVFLLVVFTGCSLLETEEPTATPEAPTVPP
jgi:hypothetical protein